MAEPMNAMDTHDNNWGVCGFTSALYAFYEHNPTMRVELSGAAKVGTRVFAEIKSF